MYVVKKGDTLFGIARSIGVPISRLLELNGMTDRNRIKVGQKLYIPQDRGSTPAPQPADVVAAKPADRERRGPHAVAARHGVAIGTFFSPDLASPRPL